MTTILALVILLVTVIHAGSEYRDSRLANWLAADVGFVPRPWLATPLYLLASVNILVPLTVAVATGSGAAWSVTAGALLADALCTHILPSMVSVRGAVPGLRTAPLQLAAVIAILFMAASISNLWGLVGVSLFAPLRLLLLPLAWWDRRILEG